MGKSARRCRRMIGVLDILCLRFCASACGFSPDRSISPDMNRTIFHVSRPDLGVLRGVVRVGASDAGRVGRVRGSTGKNTTGKNAPVWGASSEPSRGARRIGAGVSDAAPPVAQQWVPVPPRGDSRPLPPTVHEARSAGSNGVGDGAEGCSSGDGVFRFVTARPCVEAVGRGAGGRAVTPARPGRWASSPVAARGWAASGWAANRGSRWSVVGPFAGPGVCKGGRKEPERA